MEQNNNLNIGDSLAIPATGSEPVARQQGPAPVAAADRLQTIDIIRGVALLGILLMNIPGFGIYWSAFYDILVGPKNTADYYSFAVIETFFSGTMRGLFSMLFGAGMVLFMTNKIEKPGGPTVAEYYYRRLLWLTGFGLLNAYIFLWFGDILFFYGLIGMLLFPFRKLAPRWLLLLGLVCIGMGVIKTQWRYEEEREKRIAYLEAVSAEKASKKLTEKQQAAKAEWEEREKNIKPKPEEMNEHLSKMRSGYGTIFEYFIPRNANIETWDLYHGIWDMLSMMLIGMGLFGLGFFSNRLSTSTYTMTLLLGYGLGIPLSWVIFNNAYNQFLTPGAYLDAFRTPHNAAYDIRRVLLCMGHASLILLVFRSRVVPWLMKGLANVGQMAFTNYLMQSIICSLFFNGFGLGYYHKLAFHQLYYVVGCIWVFQIIFSAIWLRYFRFGPFEWVWRSLTYWKAQPMRKMQQLQPAPAATTKVIMVDEDVKTP